MASDFILNEDHERWAKSAYRKYKKSREFWRNLIKKQEGRCALTGARLLFAADSGTSKSGGHGCHPLYAAVDHINPKRTDRGFQILCYDINDLKGHLPPPLFSGLIRSPEWKKFAQTWKKAAASPTANRETFKRLIAKGSPL